MLTSLLAAVALAPVRLVTVVWDGAADWVVDDMLERGQLPNVARLKQSGMCAESVIPAWPSKTAVGHASLFTGCWPDRHGVTNNTVGLLPRAEHSLDESMRGFDANAVKAEPIWVSAAKAGRQVVALSAATSFPPEPWLQQIQQGGGNPRKFIEFSGFEKTWEEAKMIREAKPQTLSVAGTEVSLTLVDDPADPTVGLDTAVLSSGSWQAKLKPSGGSESLAGWSEPLSIVKDGGAANAYFRLFSLAADGSGMELYQRKVTPLYGTESLDEVKKYLAAYGGFHDDFFRQYERGMFGTTLMKGGSGEAEKRILEIVRQDCQFLKQGFAYAWKRWRPDLLMHYTPMSDSAGHTWMGMMDPDTLADPALAEKLWPVYREVYRLQDDWLGFMMDTVGKGAVVALMSDHGMAGANRSLAVNTILARAGLCAGDQRGEVDWSKSKIAAPSWSDFFLTVNCGTKNATVLPAEKAAVVAAAAKALLDARDDDGQPLVTAVFWPEDAAGMGIGGENGGDLYFELAKGLYPSSRIGTTLTAPYSSNGPGGVHGFFPYRRKMGAIFYAAGPRIAAGRTLPVIRHIDVFPTLCRITGLPQPKDAVGVAY